MDIKNGDFFDKNVYDTLYKLFVASPSKGIAQSEAYLKPPKFGNFADFLEEVKKTQKSQCCTVSWEKTMLSARCLDCQLQDNSCICIPCYLAGKHDQHHSYLLGSSGAGNCDCGDSTFWKAGCNCPNHPGQENNPDITQMTSESRVKFITVFAAALNSALSINFNDSINESNCIASLTWIEGYIYIGDGLRRCVSIAVSSVDPTFFFQTISTMAKSVISTLIKLLGGLVSDQFFNKMMGITLFQFYPNLQKNYASMMIEGEYDKKKAPILPLRKFFSFSFHFFNGLSVKDAIEKTNFNWVEFSLEIIKYAIEYACQLKDNNFNRCNDSGVVGRLWYIEKLIGPISKRDDQKANTQTFINKYSQLLSKYENVFSFYFLTKPMDDDLTDCIPFIDLSRKLNAISSIVSKDIQSIEETFKSLITFLRSKPLDAISVCKENVPISSFLPLHYLFSCLLCNYSNIPQIIRQECNKNGITVESFCKLASIIPLRIIAASIMQNKFIGFYNRFYRYYLMTAFISPNISFQNLFVLVQMLFGTTSDKENFIQNIIATFGAYTDMTAATDAAIFLMGLVLDRSLISQDKIMITRLRTISLLKEKRASTAEIESEVDDKLSNPVFGDNLLSYAERVTTKKGSSFQLKEDAEFTIFFPLISPIRRNKIITQIQDKLVPFLDFVELPFELSLKSCLMCPSYTSLMIECLIQSSITPTQVGLVMFVTTVRNSHYMFDNPKLQIIGENLLMTSINIKSIKNIFSFTINRDDTQFSLIQLVQIKKELGISALEKTDLPLELRPAQNEEAKKKQKAKVNSLKENIMNNFHDRMNSYLSSASAAAEDDEPISARPTSRLSGSLLGNSISDLKCVICNEATKDVIGYPCITTPSMFPAIIDNRLHNLNLKIEDLNAVTSVNICLHQVHHPCFGTGRLKRTCSIDRGDRNCLLPIISAKIGDPPSAAIRKAVDSFFKRAFVLNKKEPIIHPLESFTATVKILEVRHRSRPECLDHPTVPALLSNFMKSLYIKLHDCSIIQDITDPLIKLMFFLVNSKEPTIELSNFVQQIGNHLKDDYLFEFLRRAMIVQHFALGCSEMDSDKFIDWDEILSFKFLAERFHIDKMYDEELPIFETIPLPERYIGLSQKPFNYEIFDFAIVKFVDLLTGDVVFYTRNEEKIQSHLQSLSQYSTKYHGGLIMMMSLTGPNASDVIFNCDFMHPHPWNIGGFYLDQFGDCDRGFLRGAMLTLSKDKLDNILDMALAGDYILYK